MAMKKTTAKKATVKKSLPKAQAGGYSSLYGGKESNKSRSNKSAIVAGIIGSTVGTISAAIAKRKKKKEAELAKKVKEDIRKEIADKETKKYGGVKKSLVKAKNGRITDPEGNVIKTKTNKRTGVTKTVVKYSNPMSSGKRRDVSYSQDKPAVYVSRPDWAKEDLEPASKMKKGGAKKSLPKAQTGKQTPFQEYMKNPGAVASDTLVKSAYYKTPLDLKLANSRTDSPRYYDVPNYPSAKNPKNQKALDKARDKTYGVNRYYEGTPNKDESIEQYMRRMGPMKKGGSTSSTKKSLDKTLTGTTKMKKGGSTGDKKWIQKAINPEHKGFCTPMTKPTCTPKRKALAITLKKMAKARKG